MVDDLQLVLVTVEMADVLRGVVRINLAGLVLFAFQYAVIRGGVAVAGRPVDEWEILKGSVLYVLPAVYVFFTVPFMLVYLLGSQRWERRLRREWQLRSLSTWRPAYERTVTPRVPEDRVESFLTGELASETTTVGVDERTGRKVWRVMYQAVMRQIEVLPDETGGRVTFRIHLVDPRGILSSLDVPGARILAGIVRRAYEKGVIDDEVPDPRDWWRLDKDQKHPVGRWLNRGSGVLDL